MPINILMPALSPTMEKGNLAKWLKKEGDKVKSGDVIAEIETDKATMEVESADDGTLGKIVVPEGAEGVKVNEVIGLLLEEGEDKSALAGADTKASAVAAPKPAPIAATPGSGPGGRVIKLDVERARKEGVPTRPARPVAAGPRAPGDAAYEDVRVSQMRRIIAERLSESKRTIPHYYVTLDCDIDQL